MKRCMIVDGSSVIRKVASRILNGPDMIVVEAATGSDALSMCASDLPDIVIVDSRLPDMAADDLIRRIAALDPDFTPQIVICMIEFDVGIIMRARRAGAKGHLMKPFNRTQLLERFRDLELAA
jgi:two-component system chemotaxis response regulator CheY